MVSGSERRKYQQVRKRRNQREERGVEKAEFCSISKHCCDPVLTFLISLHLSSSDPHLFSSRARFSVFYFFSPQISPLLRNLLPFCWVALRVSCDINNFVNVAHLLIVAVLILFAHCLSPLYLSLSFPCSHNTLCCSTTVMCCKVIIATATRAKARTKWLMVSGPAGCHRGGII